MTPHPSGDGEQSTRRRILAATFVVLSRDGRRKLQLSDVAAEANVSRPTLYRYFGSKDGLLEAFGLYEQDNFDSGIAAAMAGLSGARPTGRGVAVHRRVPEQLLARFTGRYRA